MLRLLVILSLLAAPALAEPAAPVEPLPRRPMLGVVFAPVDGPGAGIGSVVPGTTAADLGLAPGDVIVRFGDAGVAGPQALVGLIRALRAGDPVTLGVRRGDEFFWLEGAMKERPRESRVGSVTYYGTVDLGGTRLRAILTRPDGDGPFPALYLIPGLGPVSVDYPFDDAAPYRRIIDAFARAGYVTLRVQKPGVGDSEGGPSADVDFETETRGFLRGLEMLKSLDYVDDENVFVFGHSMGGVMGPIIAGEQPVRGLVVYGTTALTWAEYELENNRRQAVLAGDDDAATDEAIRRRTAFFHDLYFAGKSLAEALEANPAMKPEFPDPTRMYGKTPRFFVQLANRNLASAWQECPGRVLALWGEGDFISGPRDHRTLVEIVNRKRPGTAEYRAVSGIDHFFNHAASPEESFRNMRERTPGPFEEKIVRIALEWVEKVRKGPR
jgi:pimeloyl-ACP methyl ester carboxylesterase